MKYRLLNTLLVVCILTNLSRAQSGKSISLVVSYAEPLQSMQYRNSQSFGGFLMYGSSLNETFRFMVQTGAYVWGSNTNTARESTRYSLSVPLIAGVDVLFSDNYLVPFLGVRGGVHFFSGDVIKLVTDQSPFTDDTFQIVEEVNNKLGFLIHPDIGWRFPFSDLAHLDLRAGYSRGTGKETAFSYATFNLGFVLAFPTSL